MFDFSSYFSNTAFITSKGELYTYKNVSILSEELGKYIQPHSLIFILCSNTIGSVLGYLSSFKVNAVPLLLSKEIDKSLLSEFIRKYSPTYLWLPDEMAHEYCDKEFIFMFIDPPL